LEHGGSLAGEGRCVVRRYNTSKITKIQIWEVQADEIRAMVSGKGTSPVWIFAAIEVWSRLWPATVVGRRSYRNTLKLFRVLCARSVGDHRPLIATDGFKFYRQVVRRLFGVACLYGQVIKNGGMLAYGIWLSFVVFK
jgi:IS1 family transposase